MIDFILELIAKLLGGRDDNSIPPDALTSDALTSGAPDEIDDDRTTPVDLPPEESPESEKATTPPVVPPPPILPSSGVSAEVIGATEPPPPVTTTEPVHTGITTVGAWCGGRSLANPEKYVDFAVENGINRLDVVVNDHSKWREQTDFTVRRRERIIRLAKVAQRSGIEIHLMSWIMPHPQYIMQAAELLIPLAEATQAASIQWDAEEPWMVAKNHQGYQYAGDLIGESFKDLGIPMGVNGIGYASVKKLKPLADVCDYVVPQVYSTAKNGLDPATSPAKFHKRWFRNFGKPVVMGLAAYKQKGIQNFSQQEAMQVAIDATQLLPVQTVIYWSLYHITKNPSVARAIAGIRKPLLNSSVA